MTDYWFRVSKACWLLLLVPVLLVLAGCGQGEGVQRFDVSGTVTYDGQPVPAGTVLFQPDESQGGSGPAGVATIKDGKYDTATENGKGVVGGPHLVRIVGLDGKTIDDMTPMGIPLFPDYTTEVDFPKEDTTHDFQVPADYKG